MAFGLRVDRDSGDLKSADLGGIDFGVGVDLEV
jgi:hypothetical protein